MKFKPLPHDTTLEAAQVQFAIFRRMQPADRVKIAVELSEAIRANLEAGIRRRHSEYTNPGSQFGVQNLFCNGRKAEQVLHSRAATHVIVGDGEVKPLMNQGHFLARIKEKLDNASIPFMVVGSLGSSAYGEVRATYDIDLVIDPTLAQLQAFVHSLDKADYYASENAAEEALKTRSMFNVIDLQTGWKVDLIIRLNRPYSVEEFERRRKQEVFGIELDVVSPEDAILSKLEWAKAGELEWQYRDALGVAAVQWSDLDWEYIEKWAPILEVEGLLKQLREAAASLH